MTVDKNKFISYCIVNTMLMVCGIFLNVNPLFLIALLLWANMMIYSICQIKRRIVLFCFGVSFFVFLLGRDGMEQYFNHEIVTPFTEEINNHAFFAMALSLSGIWIPYSLISRRTKDNHPNFELSPKLNQYLKYIRKYSKIAFFTVYPFSVAINLFIASFVIRYGYLSSYTDLKTIIENSPSFYILSKIELLLPSSLAIFMAALPSKKEFKLVGNAYFIYLVITLACGARGDFVLGVLLLIIFIVFMQSINPNVEWINKKYVKFGVILLPFVVIAASFYNNIRHGEDTKDLSMSDGFTNFFYDQGVSSNVIKRGYQFENDIPKQNGFYTFEFLYTGLPARLLGIPVYQGNTIEHAYEGHSFLHAFGYTVMGTAYLAGGGPGSSYIAELYYDFGYLGVFLGSCIYGYLFSLIGNFCAKKIFRRCIIFMIIPRLLWAPRGTFSGFITFLIAPTTIILIILIFVSAQISYINWIKRHKTKRVNNDIYQSIFITK